MGKAAFQKYAEDTEAQMKRWYEHLSEKDKRCYAALEAKKLGYGGQRYICRLLGCSPTTMRVGQKELQEGFVTLQESIRKPGGGRKKIREKMKGVDEVFLEIVGECTAGSPMDDKMKWTHLNATGVSRSLHERGYPVSPYVVKQLFKKYGYVKRKMQKTKTVKEAAQRNEQFENIQVLREHYEKEGDPIISVDVKKRGDR